MVEYTLHMDAVFGSLADPTRRDILSRVARREYSVGELVACYDMSFAAISKHLKILEAARLIKKRKEGKQRIVVLAPDTLKDADAYLGQYRQIWQSRYDKLDNLINERS